MSHLFSELLCSHPLNSLNVFYVVVSILFFLFVCFFKTIFILNNFIFINLRYYFILFIILRILSFQLFTPFNYLLSGFLSYLVFLVFKG